jgi:hypothetical protein
MISGIANCHMACTSFVVHGVFATLTGGVSHFSVREVHDGVIYGLFYDAVGIKTIEKVCRAGLTNFKLLRGLQCTLDI